MNIFNHSNPGSFPVVLLLSTLATLAVSWLVTVSGPLRYMFGLATPPGALLPGSSLGGLLPLAVMSCLFILLTIVVNVV